MTVGKLDIVKNEMRRLRIDIPGISELHWTENGFFNSHDYVVYYSGNDNIRRNGIAFIAYKKTTKAINSFECISDRIISLRLDGKSRSIAIIQVYAPTADATEEDREKFYVDLQLTIDHSPAKDVKFIIGDFNAKVGNAEEGPAIGKFGLGEQNDASDRLVQ